MDAATVSHNIFLISKEKEGILYSNKIIKYITIKYLKLVYLKKSKFHIIRRILCLDQLYVQQTNSPWIY